MKAETDESCICVRQLLTAGEKVVTARTLSVVDVCTNVHSMCVCVQVHCAWHVTLLVERSLGREGRKRKEKHSSGGESTLLFSSLFSTPLYSTVTVHISPNRRIHKGENESVKKRVK